MVLLCIFLIYVGIYVSCTCSLPKYRAVKAVIRGEENYTIEALYVWGWKAYEPFSTPGDGWTYTTWWGYYFSGPNAKIECEMQIRELYKKHRLYSIMNNRIVNKLKDKIVLKLNKMWYRVLLKISDWTRT